MTALFVRVSVFFGGRQLDVSLPAQRPTVDIIDDVVTLFLRNPEQDDTVGSENPGMVVPEAHTWILSSPTLGIIEPHHSLEDRGVADGERLYLSSRHEAAHSPFVDDAIAEVRTTIGDSQWRWSEQTRSSGILAVVAVILALLLLMIGVALRSGESSSPALLIALQVALAVALAGLALWKPHDWMRWLGVSLPVAALFVGGHLTAGVPIANGGPTLLAGSAFAGALAAYISGRGKPVGAIAGTTAHLILAVAGGAAAAATALGANLYALSAWGAWLPVLVLIAAPALAINSTGLATLLRINDTGEQVQRSVIRAKARRSEAVSRGIVWGATAVSGAIIFTLSTSPYWQHGVIVALLCPLVLLRANGFADARIIAPLLTTGIFGVALLAGSLVVWSANGWEPHSTAAWFAPGSGAPGGAWIAALAVVALAAVILSLLHRWEPDELQEARLARVLSAADVVACLAIIPLILAAQGVFSYYWATT
ncbi:type VII secretion integral membrane protein EccD [Corynebacterium mayonis]|uniref:type VII secretion integral membrane protein EccD n=1 Tax=Corynebacterium mayonis TaxID=3062461 RepID=UPI00314067C3